MDGRRLGQHSLQRFATKIISILHENRQNYIKLVDILMKNKQNGRRSDTFIKLKSTLLNLKFRYGKVLAWYVLVLFPRFLPWTNVEET